MVRIKSVEFHCSKSTTTHALRLCTEEFPIKMDAALRSIVCDLRRRKRERERGSANVPAQGLVVYCACASYRVQIQIHMYQRKRIVSYVLIRITTTHYTYFPWNGQPIRAAIYRGNFPLSSFASIFVTFFFYFFYLFILLYKNGFNHKENGNETQRVHGAHVIDINKVQAERRRAGVADTLSHGHQSRIEQSIRKHLSARIINFSNIRRRRG